MKKIIITLLFILSNPIFCQNTYNASSYTVSLNDVKNKKYSLDTLSNAFFIYEKGFSRVEESENYGLVLDYKAKIKILNAKGYDYANVEIQLYKDEKVKKIVAQTYNLENGSIKKTKLTKDQIFKTKESEKFTTVKFALPNVKPGSVITYSYRTVSPYMFRFQDWEFQDDIPKLHSEYITDILGNYNYNTRFIGRLKLKQKETSIIKNCVGYGENAGSCLHSEYSLDSIPAFKYQEYLTSRKNYLSAIRYELNSFTNVYGKKKEYSKTWKTAENDLKEDIGFGQQLKKLRIANKVLEEKIELQSPSLDYAKKIFKLVKNDYKWDSKNFYFKNIDLKEVLQKKEGNIAEINMVLHNFLKSQGFEVYPVLVSTRINGYPVKLHPVISGFNYMIVKLIFNKEEFLLDATDEFLSFGELPFKCLNNEGRLINIAGNGSWQSLLPKNSVRKVFLDKIKITEDESITGNISTFYKGQEATKMRKLLEKSSVEKIFDIPDVEIENIKIENQNNIDLPLKINFEYTSEILKIDDTFLFNPFTFPFFTTNKFLDKERLYPIDYGYKRDFIYNTTVTIPENYTFSEVPESKAYGLPDNGGKLMIQYGIQGQKLSIRLRLNLNKTIYPASYYPTLKEVYNKIVTSQNKDLVSVKIK